MSIRRSPNGGAHCTASGCNFVSTAPLSHYPAGCPQCAGNGLRTADRSTTVDAVLRARAARVKPHAGWPHKAQAPSTSWTDSSRDRWGGRKGSSDRAFWTNGNCLRGSIATLLNIDVKLVPDPGPLFGDPHWRNRYETELRSKLGVQFDEYPASTCPPKGPGLWIAVLDDGDVNHALLARDMLVCHDPNHGKLNGQAVPKKGLMFGLRVVKVPVLKTLTRWPGSAYAA